MSYSNIVNSPFTLLNCPAPGAKGSSNWKEYVEKEEEGKDHDRAIATRDNRFVESEQSELKRLKDYQN